MVMSAFRRSVKADTKKAVGKGRKGSVFERMRLPVDVPVPFIVINAEYVDPNPAPEEIEVDPATGRPLEVKKTYFKVRKHKRSLQGANGGKGRFPESICSAGWNAHAPQPCAGCSAMDQGDKSVGISDLAAFGIVHLGVYHRHPLIDRQTGGIVMKQAQQGRQAEPVMIDTECSGRTCNFCRATQGQPIVNDPQNPWPNFRPQDIQTFFGKRRYMELGKNHLTNLGGWDASIASMCGNDGSQLITDGYKCPTCQTLVIDMAQDARTDAQILEAVSKPVPCMRCQRQVLLEEVVACEVCEQAGRQPRQLGLSDRVLWGMRQGEGTGSQLVLHRHESLQEFFQRVPAQFLNGKTPEAFLAELAKPYEFDKVFEPRPIGEQMKELQLQGQGPVPGNVMPGYQQPGPGGYQQAGSFGPQGNIPQGYGAPPPPPGFAAPLPQGGFQQAPAPGGYPAPAPQAPGPQAPGPMMRPNIGQGQ